MIAQILLIALPLFSLNCTETKLFPDFPDTPIPQLNETLDDLSRLTFIHCQSPAPRVNKHWEQDEAYIVEKPDVYDACWSVTSYWPFRLVALHGSSPFSLPGVTQTLYTGEGSDTTEYLFMPGEEIEWRKLPESIVESQLLHPGNEMAYWDAVKWNMNADDTPRMTGDGTYIYPGEENNLVAGPLQTYWSTFVFPNNGGRLVQHDSFGNVTYQKGVFWHDKYMTYVIGVDILTWRNVHYLECGGEIIYENTVGGEYLPCFYGEYDEQTEKCPGP